MQKLALALSIDVADSTPLDEALLRASIRLREVSRTAGKRRVDERFEIEENGLAIAAVIQEID